MKAGFAMITYYWFSYYLVTGCIIKLNKAKIYITKQFLLLDNSDMADHKVIINKLDNVDTHSCPKKVNGTGLIINITDSRFMPDYQKKILLQHYPNPNMLKYIKYAEINVSMPGVCIYTSIKHDGKYIAFGEAVNKNFRDIDTGKIKFYVYTLPDMQFVTETEHTICGNIYTSGSQTQPIFNGGIRWLDEEPGYNFIVASWEDTYNYNDLNRTKLYIHGYEQQYTLIDPTGKMGKYKYNWIGPKKCLEVYMNALDAEQEIDAGIIDKFSLLDAGTPTLLPDIKNLKLSMMAPMFQELSPELIPGILGYIPIEDKLELLMD